MIAYVTLDESQFRELVAGEIVNDAGRLGYDDDDAVKIIVNIVLSDIGFAAMRRALDEAEAAAVSRLRNLRVEQG